MAKVEGFTIELDPKEKAVIDKWLSEMGDVDQEAVIQNALKRGMETIISQGKVNLDARNQVRTGGLKRSFTQKVNKKKAYVLGGFKRAGKLTAKRSIGGNAAHLVDRGTAKRWTLSGAYRGSVSKGAPNKGSYFWTDAIEAKGPAAVDNLMDAIYQALNDITNRNKN